MLQPDHVAKNLPLGFLPPEPDTIEVKGMGKGALTRRVTVNRAEHPLAWLHARGMISDAQLIAGEVLRKAYERAGLRATTTQNYAFPPRANAKASAQTDDMLGGIERADSVRLALQAVGPGLADVLLRTVCNGDALPDTEKALNWPARSGRIILGLALDRLVTYIGLDDEGNHCGT